MRKLICTLPNASHEINGIAFEPHASGGVISKEPLDADLLALFAAIPGYAVVADADSVAVDAPHPVAELPAGDDGAVPGDHAAGQADAAVPAAAAAAPAAPKKKPAAKK